MSVTQRVKNPNVVSPSSGVAFSGEKEPKYRYVLHADASQTLSGVKGARPKRSQYLMYVKGPE